MLLARRGGGGGEGGRGVAAGRTLLQKPFSQPAGHALSAAAGDQGGYGRRQSCEQRNVHTALEGEPAWGARSGCCGVSGTAAESGGSQGAGTYSWGYHPAAGGGEKPLAWPACPPENRFVSPSCEQTSSLCQERAGVRRAPRDAAVCPAPGPDPASTHEGAHVPARADVGSLESHPTQM